MFSLEFWQQALAILLALVLTSVILGWLSWNVRFKMFAPMVFAGLGAVGLLAWAGSTPGSSAGELVLWFLGAVPLFSFLEYLGHRYVLHYSGPVGPFEKVIYDLHQNHHDAPRDQGLQPTSMAVSVPIFVLVGIALIHLLGVAHGATFLAGLVVCYGYYEWVHYAIHNLPAKTPWTRWQKRLHRYHHYRDSQCNYGLTSPLWDRIWGTLILPEKSQSLG